jgi:hypothetical protein
MVLIKILVRLPQYDDRRIGRKILASKDSKALRRAFCPSGEPLPAISLDATRTSYGLTCPRLSA